MKRDLRRRISRVTLLIAILSLAVPGLSEAGLSEAVHGARVTELPAPGVADGRPVGDDPVVVESGSESLILEWRAPAFVLRRTLSPEGRDGVLVDAAGWSDEETPGEPPLPLAAVTIVLPPRGDVDVRIEEHATTSQSLPGPLLMAPDVVLPHFEAPGVKGHPSEPADGRTLGPAEGSREVVSFDEIGSLRGYRLGQLTFRPFAYDAGRRALDVVEGVRVELTFAPAEDAGVSDGGRALNGDDSPLLDVLRQSVINPDQMAAFAPRTERAGGSVLKLSEQGAGSRYKVGVAEEGVYELAYSTLASAGITLASAPPAGLRMEHAGSEVSYHWDDDGNGVFDAGDSILFYARPTTSRWVDYDVYWIETGAQGTLITTRSGDPSGVGETGTLWATVVAESNVGENNYLTEYPSDRDGDHWYWDRLSAGGDNTGSYTVDLLTPANTVVPAELTLYLQGVTAHKDLDPDHHVDATVAGEPLASPVVWNGLTYVSATRTVDSSDLEAGSNQVGLSVPDRGGLDQVWLDALKLRYPIAGVAGEPARLQGEAGRKRYSFGGLSGGAPVVWDVTQPESPREVTGATYGGGTVTLADADTGVTDYFVLGEGQTENPLWIEPASSLEESVDGAEYLIIAHSDFMSSLGPLVTYRETQDGLDVRIVSVEAVYDVCGEGRMDPLAIRECISYTYHSVSPPALDYVLLVGDGTHDPLNNKESAYWQETYVPPYLAMVDLFSGEVPADNRFATVDGGGAGEDIVPDVAIGRLPVQTSDQADVVVGKVLGYEGRTLTWPWNERLLYFADAHAYDYFHDESDEIYSNTLGIEPFSPARYYLCMEDCDEPYLLDGKAATKEATLRALNQGALLATWVGHASWHQWSPEAVFHLSDVPALENGETLPVMLEMTCFTSYFSLPDTDVLDEALLRLEGGGAVATWGSTGTGLTSGHVELHKGFVDAALGKGQDPVALGPAAVAGRLALGDDTPSKRSLWDTYVLFGDPAMYLNLDIVPWAHQVSLPVVFRGAP